MVKFNSYNHDKQILRKVSLSLVFLLLSWWGTVPVHWVHHLKIPSAIFDQAVEVHLTEALPSSKEVPNPHSNTTEHDECHVLSISKSAKTYSISQFLEDNTHQNSRLEQIKTDFLPLHASKIYITTFPSRAPPHLLAYS